MHPYQKMLNALFCCGNELFPVVWLRHIINFNDFLFVEVAKQIRICNKYFPISYLIEKMSPLWAKCLKPLHLVSYLKKMAKWLFAKKDEIYVSSYRLWILNSFNFKIKLSSNSLYTIYMLRNGLSHISCMEHLDFHI